MDLNPPLQSIPTPTKTKPQLTPPDIVSYLNAFTIYFNNYLFCILAKQNSHLGVFYISDQGTK